jgi:predicted aspartyl protease
MFLDTGATRTTITPRLREHLGLEMEPIQAIGIGARVQDMNLASLGSLQVLGFADTLAEDMRVLVTRVPLYDGLLGLDYLSRFAKVSRMTSPPTLSS